ERDGFAGPNLSGGSQRIRCLKRAPGVESRLVLGCGFEHFLERAVCSRGRKMDQQFYATGADVESDGSCDDFCREPYDSGLSREHHRRRVGAKARGNWLLGLCALWDPGNDSDDGGWDDYSTSAELIPSFVTLIWSRRVRLLQQRFHFAFFVQES